MMTLKSSGRLRPAATFSSGMGTGFGWVKRNYIAHCCNAARRAPMMRSGELGGVRRRTGDTSERRLPKVRRGALGLAEALEQLGQCQVDARCHVAIAIIGQ